MFKKAILVVLQTLLFLILFAAGSFLPALPSFRSWYWQMQAGPGRVFVLDGLLLALLVYVVIFVIEAARKRIRGAGALTTLALVLALALGFAMKMGFKTI